MDFYNCDLPDSVLSSLFLEDRPRMILERLQKKQTGYICRENYT